MEEEEDFTVYQNIAIILVSIIIMSAILGASRASWSIKYGRKFGKKK